MSGSEIVRDIHGLAEAVEIVARSHRLATQAVVEHYPPRPDLYGRPREPGGIFAYQFFDTQGGNCGYYLQDLRSVHIFETPRKWGIPKEHIMGIRSLLDRPQTAS